MSHAALPPRSSRASAAWESARDRAVASAKKAAAAKATTKATTIGAEAASSGDDDDEEDDGADAGATTAAEVSRSPECLWNACVRRRWAVSDRVCAMT